MPCNKCDHKFIKYSDPRCTNSMYMKKILVRERKNIQCYACGYKYRSRSRSRYRLRSRSRSWSRSWSWSWSKSWSGSESRSRSRFSPNLDCGIQLSRYAKFCLPTLSRSWLKVKSSQLLFISYYFQQLQCHPAWVCLAWMGCNNSIIFLSGLSSTGYQSCLECTHEWQFSRAAFLKKERQKDIQTEKLES